jgi:hypothetical protein
MRVTQGRSGSDLEVGGELDKAEHALAGRLSGSDRQ